MTAPEPRTLDEAAEWLRKHFRAAASQGLHAVFRLELTGEAGGVLQVRIDDGRVDVRCEPCPEADLVMKLAARDFFGILGGRENAEMLFMADRIVAEGDLSLAMRFRSLFRARAA